MDSSREPQFSSEPHELCSRPLLCVPVPSGVSVQFPLPVWVAVGNSLSSSTATSHCDFSPI